MINFIWKVLEKLDSNWGYSTPIQKRFRIGQYCQISKHKSNDTNLEVGEPVKIVEIGRHDYLIQDFKTNELHIVYQFELTPDINF